MKLYIKSMTENRKDIIDDVQDKAQPIIEHIIKLYGYPDDTNHHKWIKDLYSFIPTVPTVKGKHKYPKEQDLFYALWGKRWAAKFDKLYRDIQARYGVIDISEEEMRRVVVQYLQWLARELSTEGSVFYIDIEDYVDNNLRR